MCRAQIQNLLQYFARLDRARQHIFQHSIHYWTGCLRGLLASHQLPGWKDTYPYVLYFHTFSGDKAQVEQMIIFAARCCLKRIKDERVDWI